MSKNLYIIRKYIYAKSVAQALKLDKSKDADDVWLDEDYRRMKLNNPNIGEYGYKTKKK